MTLFLNYLPLRMRDRTIFEKGNLKIRFLIFVRSDIPLALFCRFFPATFSATSAPIPNALIPATYSSIDEENNEFQIYFNSNFGLPDFCIRESVMYVYLSIFSMKYR